MGFGAFPVPVQRVEMVEVPTVDVAAIRASTDLSQSAFAHSIGVTKGTQPN